MRAMNALTRFLCLILGISVDGGAAQREQWARRRKELGLEPGEGDPDQRADEAGVHSPRARETHGAPAHAERK